MALWASLCACPAPANLEGRGATPAAPAARPDTGPNPPRAPSAAGSIGAGIDPAPPKFRLPEGVRPIRYQLDLTLIPEQPRFRGEVTIAVELARPTQVIWLNARELDVQSARLTSDGQTHPARVLDGGSDFVGFALPHPHGPGSATLRVRYTAAFAGEKTVGLYRVKEPDGQWHVYSMFQPLEARRAFPCFDEPGYKVPWQLTIRAPKGHVALANAPVASQREESNLTVVRFHESKPMPSYLVALVVGPFEVVAGGTAGQNNVRVRYIIPQGREAELWYSKQATPKVVALLEEYFGTPYPYEKLDVAVVPRFWGTMEHPGLVAMGQPLSLIRPEDDSTQRRRSYANILAHELSHYWFGNLVTHAWWNDIWLNEGLGTWLDRKITDRFEPSWDFYAETMWRRDNAMNKDALLSAKRIRQPAGSNDAIAHSFDNPITYGKSALVIGMLEHFFGEERFRAGIRHYLSELAWGSARSKDFVALMSEKVGPTFGPALQTFLDQPGYPLVSVELACDRGQPARVELTQRRFVNIGSAAAPDQTWSFPLCMRYGAGRARHRQCALITEPRAVIELDRGARCPQWLTANERGAGYYRVQYGPKLLSRLLGTAANKLTIGERIALLSDLTALMRTGDVTLDNLLAVVPKLTRDGNRHIVQRSIAIMLWARRMMPAELEANYARYIRKVYGPLTRQLGWKKRRGEPQRFTDLRPILFATMGRSGKDRKLQARSRKLALAYLRDRSAIAPEMVQAVLGVAARSGDRVLFKAFLAAAQSAKDRRERSRFLRYLGLFPDPPLIEKALAIVASGEADLRDSVLILRSAITNRKTRDQAWSFVEKHFDALIQRSSPLTASQGFYLPQLFCDQGKLDRVKAFLDPRVAKVEGARPIYENALESARACIALKGIQAPAVRRFLARH